VVARQDVIQEAESRRTPRNPRRHELRPVSDLDLSAFDLVSAAVELLGGPRREERPRSSSKVIHEGGDSFLRVRERRTGSEPHPDAILRSEERRVGKEERVRN